LKSFLIDFCKLLLQHDHNNMGNSQNRSANTDEKSPPGGATLLRVGVAGGGGAGGVGGALVERRNSRVRVLSRLMGQKRIREAFLHSPSDFQGNRKVHPS